ncbi:unnamed protein product, partial [Effrenium voratum]
TRRNFQGMDERFGNKATVRTVTRSQYPDEEDARRALLNQLIENALEGPTLRLLRHNPEELPRRELPPGKWSGIFGLYLARCLAMGERPASRSTFYRVVGRWRTCLHFRERSSHSTCLTCDRLRAKMRHASDFTTHATAADQLLGHLRVAWACKQQYWLARATSRMKSELLTLIIDGFDKSKTLLPRWTRGRTPKGTVFEKNIRTNLNLSAVHAHGWGFYVYISDEQISAGSSWSWEIVFRTLEHVFHSARRSNLRVPSGLWIQSDNTVKEIKNSVSGLLCSYLASLGYFEDIGHYHLPKGHTHEDIDGIFGVISLAVLESQDDCQTPGDVCRVIESKLQPIFARRNEEMRVIYVHKVRRWRELLPNVVMLKKAPVLFCILSLHIDIKQTISMSGA